MTPGKKRRYKFLEVDRIDLVDRGANFDRSTGDGSHILLVKRDSSQEPVVMPEPTAIDVQKMIADALAEERKTQKAERDAAIAKAVEEAEAKAKREAEVEKAALAKRAEDAEKAAKEAQEIAKAEQERREVAAACDTVRKYAPLALDVEKDGPLVYRLSKALTAEDNARLHDILTAASEQVRLGKLFSERGRGGEPPVGDPNGNPEQAFLAKAEELRKADPTLTQPDAILKARELYPTERQRYDAWMRERAAPAIR